MDKKKIRPIKKLIIRHPRLQAIRRNFRTVIKLAVLDEYEKLRNLEGFYLDKLMKFHKLTPTQSRRKRQLGLLRTYLKEAFFNSILVCENRSGLHDSNITGDRVRFPDIREFDKCFIKEKNARYYFQKKWYSLEYYNDHSTLFEDYWKKMKTRMETVPGNVATLDELHQKDIKRLQDDFFKRKLEYEQKKVLQFPEVVQLIIDLLGQNKYTVISAPMLLKEGLMQIQKINEIFDITLRVGDFDMNNKNVRFLTVRPQPNLPIDQIKEIFDTFLEHKELLISSQYYRSSPRKFKILFAHEHFDLHFSLIVSNAVRYSDLINSSIGRRIIKKEEIKQVFEILN